MKRMTTTKQLEILDKLSPLATEINYNKDTNTMEVGGNLYVDGAIDTTQIQMSDDGATISFNLEDNKFSFQDDYGNITSLVVKDTSEILTDKSVKTLFGNQSIYGSGNIDLYVHYLSFTINSKIYYGVVYSSNNLVVDSVQDLTTIMKSDGQILALGESDNALIAYVGGIWLDVFDKGNVTAVNDNVKTI